MRRIVTGLAGATLGVVGNLQSTCEDKELVGSDGPVVDNLLALHCVLVVVDPALIDHSDCRPIPVPVIDHTFHGSLLGGVGDIVRGDLDPPERLIVSIAPHEKERIVD